MKILVFNYEYPPIGGGGGIICRNIAEELVIFGHEVTLITSQFTGLSNEEMIKGVKVIRVPVLFRKNQNAASLLSLLSYVPACIKRARKFLKQNGCDIIHTHFAIPSGPAGQYISGKYKIPNILSIHGGDIFDPSKSLSPHQTFGLRQTVKKVLISADRVVAPSSETKTNAIGFYNVAREIDIIPLGIKPDVYLPKTRKELNLPEDKFIFATIGRLIQRKNLEELLEVLTTIKNKFPFKLLIMGEGPERKTIEKKICELNLSNNVTLLGRVTEEDKFHYLSASDTYLSTTLHEGFGIVFLESMECFLPIVCYNRGGQVDFLKDGKTGFLVEFGGKDSFTSKLIELLKNKLLRKEIGQFNKQHVKEFYIPNIAKKYESIFKQEARSSYS